MRLKKLIRKIYLPIKKIDAAGVVTSTHTEDAVVSESVADAEPKTAFAKMKAFVRKAVDCCIE